MITRTIGWQRRVLFQFKDDLGQKLRDDVKILIISFSSAQVHELRQNIREGVRDQLFFMGRAMR